MRLPTSFLLVLFLVPPASSHAAAQEPARPEEVVRALLAEARTHDERPAVATEEYTALVRIGALEVLEAHARRGLLSGLQLSKLAGYLGGQGQIARARALAELAATPLDRDAVLAVLVRHIDDPRTDALALIDSIGAPHHRLSALLQVAARGGRAGLADSAMARARELARTAVLAEVPTVPLDELVRVTRITDVIEIVTALRPVELRARLLAGQVGATEQRWMLDALAAVADSLTDPIDRQVVRLRVACARPDSADIITAARGLLASLRDAVAPDGTARTALLACVRTLGFLPGSPSPLVVLREVEAAAPPQITLDVAHAITLRWSQGLAGERRTAHEALMRSARDAGWRAAERYPGGAADSVRTSLLRSVAYTAPAVALEHVEQLANARDRDRVRLAAAEALLIAGSDTAHVVGREIRTPSERAHWQLRVTQSLALNEAHAAALDSARAIADDTVRAMALGLVGAIMRTPDTAEPAAALLSESLVVVRLRPAISEPFPQRGDPVRNWIVPAALRRLGPDTLAAWARRHETPDARAAALRFVASAQARSITEQITAGGVDPATRMPSIGPVERDALLAGLRAGVQALPAAARDSIRPALLAAWLALDTASFRVAVDDGGWDDLDPATLRFFGDEAELRAVLAMAPPDSVRDATYAGIAHARARSGTGDPFAVIDSIAGPRARLDALMVLPPMAYAVATRTIETVLRALRDASVNDAPSALPAHALQVIADSLDVGSRAVILARSLERHLTDMQPTVSPDRIAALADSVAPPLAHAIRAVAYAARPDAAMAGDALAELAHGMESADSAARATAAGLAIQAATLLGLHGEHGAAVHALQRMAPWIPAEQRVWAWAAPFQRPWPAPQDPAVTRLAWTATEPLPPTVRDSVRYFILASFIYQDPRAALDPLRDLEDARLRDALRNVAVRALRDRSDPLADTVAASFETADARALDLRIRVSALAAAGELEGGAALIDSIPTTPGRAAARTELALAVRRTGDADRADGLLRRALDDAGFAWRGDDGSLDADDETRQTVVALAVNGGMAGTVIDWARARPDPRTTVAVLLQVAAVSAFLRGF